MKKNEKYNMEYSEINGDWKGYLKRFQMPCKKTLRLPLFRMTICFMLQLPIVFICWYYREFGFPIILLVLTTTLGIISYYIKVLYKEFWNYVLVESLGFFADLLMWFYYFVLTVLSLSPVILFFVALGMKN